MKGNEWNFLNCQNGKPNSPKWKLSELIEGQYIGMLWRKVRIASNIQGEVTTN